MKNNMLTDEGPGWILDFALMGNLSQVGVVGEGDVVSRVPVQSSADINSKECW